MITHIYLIENIEPNTNKVYIGKTKDSYKNNRKNHHRWKFGKQILFTYIDQIDSIEHKDWETTESYWIEQFKQWGFDVINKNKGGGGPDYLTEEQKNKIKNKNNRGLKISLNKERSNKISIALKGIKKSNDHVANLSKAKQGISCPHKWKSIIQYDKNGTYLQEYPSLKQASIILGINYQNLYKHLQGFSKTIGGYVFKYKVK
jgi:mRNA deadenylase 3'-5' endonuclease subunit Ccr4